nr:11233_t:CDS:2 [Entrophospora candida]
MGNSISIIIVQNFGDVNIKPVCKAINIPGAKDYPKSDLAAQLSWIDQSALEFLTKNWTQNYLYEWRDDRTAPDGAVTNGAIQGTKWVAEGFGGADVSNYFQKKITEDFTQLQLITLGNKLAAIIRELLNGPEQGFRDQPTTMTIGDTKVNVYYGGGTFKGSKENVVFISYLVSWYTPASLGA